LGGPPPPHKTGVGGTTCREKCGGFGKILARREKCGGQPKPDPPDTTLSPGKTWGFVKEKNLKGNPPPPGGGRGNFAGVHKPGGWVGFWCGVVGGGEGAKNAGGEKCCPPPKRGGGGGGNYLIGWTGEHSPKIVGWFWFLSLQLCFGSPPPGGCGKKKKEEKNVVVGFFIQRENPRYKNGPPKRENQEKG